MATRYPLLGSDGVWSIEEPELEIQTGHCNTQIPGLVLGPEFDGIVL